MAIKNEKSRDTGKAGHKTQKEGKQNIAHINLKKNKQHRPHQNYRGESRCLRRISCFWKCDNKLNSNKHTVSKSSRKS